jgi:hypothetical protein
MTGNERYARGRNMLEKSPMFYERVLDVISRKKSEGEEDVVE